MSIFTESILASRPVPLLGDGCQRRDFTHVSDICDGLLASLEADDAVGEVINLGHQEPVATIELVAMLESELGRKAILDFRPAHFADVPITCAELGKARRLLNYDPKIVLQDGVREFVAWFKNARDK